VLLIFDIVERDYTGSVTRFSQEMVQAFKLMMGECLHEIAEGLNNGLDDYRIIFTHNSAALLNKTVGPEFA
jgi:hypothetical protein